MPLLRLLLILVVSVSPCVAGSGYAAEIAPDDAAALKGLKSVRAVYDVRTDNPKQLLFSLKVIEQTEKEVIKQGVVPDFILSFRGGTLPLLTNDPKGSVPEKAILSEVRERLAGMQTRGIVLEACNVAATIFKVEQKDLVNDVTLIGNSLISLIGYQNKGYALVPMY